MNEERKGASATRLLIACIVLLLLICGLAGFFWFYTSGGRTGATGTSYESVDSLDSKEMKNGLVLELLQAKKAADGLIEMRWRYVNPKSETITLCSNDQGTVLRDSIYCEYAGEKYHPFKTADGKLISTIGWVDVEPGKARSFWGRFDVPVTKEEPTVSLSFPGLLLPFEDIKVEGLSDKETAEARPRNDVAARHATGLIVSASRVKKSSGGLVEVRWGYLNPTKENILLVTSDTAKMLPQQVLLEVDATKTVNGVHRDSKGVPTASELPYTVLKPGENVEVFAKFAIEAKPDDTLTLYLPDANPISGLKLGWEK
jgi:hypothetical protein